MTEKEKRAQGELYDANYNPEIGKELLECKDKRFRYNQILPSHEEERHTAMEDILGKTGKQFTINAPFWCDFGYNIEVGENFYANHGCVILDGAKVTFGDNVFVAPNCGFHTAGYPTSDPWLVSWKRCFCRSERIISDPGTSVISQGTECKDRTGRSPLYDRNLQVYYS